MEKLWSFWEVLLIPGIAKFYENKYLEATRRSFYMLIPFWLVVSFFDILGNVILNPSGFVMGREGLDLGFWLTGGLAGEEYVQSGFSQVLQTYQSVLKVAYSVPSIVLCATLSRRLAEFWKSDKNLTMFCALFSLFLFSPVNVGNPNTALTDYFSEIGIFSAFFTTFVSVKIFSILFNKKFLRLRLPKGLPKDFSKYFSAIFPVLLTLAIFSIISFAAALIRIGGENFLHELAGSSIFQNAFFVLIFQFVVWFLWWLGIPGYGVFSTVLENVYLPAQISNGTADNIAIFTTGFFEAEVIHVLGLMIAILVFSQHNQWRAISKFSIPLMAFNIQEVFIFGLPVILNPIFFIPYIFAPIANTLIGWVAISWGIIPTFQTEIAWTMPLFLSAAISTNSIMGAVLQVVWLITDIFIYAPFVITANSFDLEEKKAVTKK